MGPGQTIEEAGARSTQQLKRLILSSPAHPIYLSVPAWKICHGKEGLHLPSPRAQLRADAQTFRLVSQVKL